MLEAKTGTAQLIEVVHQHRVDEQIAKEFALLIFPAQHAIELAGRIKGLIELGYHRVAQNTGHDQVTARVETVVLFVRHHLLVSCVPPIHAHESPLLLKGAAK